MPRVPEAWNRTPDPTPEDLAAAAFEASIERLAEAVAGSWRDERFRAATNGDSLRFRCPLCDEALGNGAPAARVLDRFTWTCDGCQVTGTRWLLERLVVEDVALLVRLGHLLHRDEQLEAELAGGDDAA